MFWVVQAFASRMVVLALLAVATVAQADALPRVAAQPLVVTGAPDATREQLTTAFLSAVARQQVEMVSSFAVDAFLSQRGGQGCGLDEACLLELCKQTQADFSISVTVALDGEQWSLRGRTLSCSGLVSREVPDGVLQVAGGPGAEAKVEEVLSLLVHHLVTGEPLPAPEPPKVAEVAEVKPPPPDAPTKLPPPKLTPAPEVAPPAVAVRAQPGWVAPTTTALWVVAAGTGGAAAALWVQNARDSQRLDTLVKANGGLLPPNEVNTAVSIDERNGAAIGLAAGAVTAAASAVAVQLLFGHEEAKR